LKVYQGKPKEKNRPLSKQVNYLFQYNCRCNVTDDAIAGGDCCKVQPVNLTRGGKNVQGSKHVTTRGQWGHLISVEEMHGKLIIRQISLFPWTLLIMDVHL
jgi:hypothetical protein